MTRSCIFSALLITLLAIACVGCTSHSYHPALFEIRHAETGEPVPGVMLIERYYNVAPIPWIHLNLREAEAVTSNQSGRVTLMLERGRSMSIETVGYPSPVWDGVIEPYQVVALRSLSDESLRLGYSEPYVMIQAGEVLPWSQVDEPAPIPWLDGRPDDAPYQLELVYLHMIRD